jgi:DNA-binding NtrC family response regulator
MSATRRILVVDDSPVTAHQLAELLATDGLEVNPERDPEVAVERLRDGSFHLLIADWRMPELDGISLLSRVRAERLPLGVIILTGHGDPLIAREAMKAGADDFVTKPIDPERFRLQVRRVLERRELLDELDGLRRRVRSEYGFGGMVSKSPRMRRVFDLIERVGPLASTVLVHGETGTGKELVARALHENSPRRARPFIDVNCAAMQPTLLESELFGHEKGAFTGAERRRQGRFELADGGTLFLDEIAELPHAMQAKLLRVLQTGEFERVGGTATLCVDVRIVAATNKRLDDEVKAGRFRNDLFYRLDVVRIELPPLRERAEDITLLATHFLERLRSKSTPPVTEIDYEAMQALIDHEWPGNVRELENAIKSAVALADGTIIHRDALPANVAPPDARRLGNGSLIDISRPLPEVTADLVGRVEREYFAQLLARYRGSVTSCARHSGLSRRSVAQKLRKYDLDRDEFRLRQDEAEA